MFFLFISASAKISRNGVKTVTKSIFAKPFFPEQLSFSDMLGIISIILAVISIVLAIIIYKLSTDTSEKLAEEAARRAFEKKYYIENRLTENTAEITKKINLNKEQRRVVKKLINQLIKRGKKNSSINPWIYAASFPIKLKDEFTEEETVGLMYEWKEKAFISWDGTLENTTKIFILKGDLILEDIDSR